MLKANTYFILTGDFEVFVCAVEGGTGGGAGGSGDSGGGGSGGADRGVRGPAKLVSSEDEETTLGAAAAAVVEGAEALGCAIEEAEAVKEANASFVSGQKADDALASESVSQLSADEAVIDEAESWADEEVTAAESCDCSSSRMEVELSTNEVVFLLAATVLSESLSDGRLLSASIVSWNRTDRFSFECSDKISARAIM